MTLIAFVLTVTDMNPENVEQRHFHSFWRSSVHRTRSRQCTTRPKRLSKSEILTISDDTSDYPPPSMSPVDTFQTSKIEGSQLVNVLVTPSGKLKVIIITLTFSNV